LLVALAEVRRLEQVLLLVTSDLEEVVIGYLLLLGGSGLILVDLRVEVLVVVMGTEARLEELLAGGDALFVLLGASCHGGLPLGLRGGLVVLVGKLLALVSSMVCVG
jgi:hypothetical protein